MRIIAGRHRGRSLVVPRDNAVRPTAARAREALFAMLDQGDPPLRGARFLDLFAGTGAIGFEAWSRGAASVLMIDQDLRLAAANHKIVGSPAEVRLVRADATRLLGPPDSFDIAFLDPPYEGDLGVRALDELRRGWLAEHASIILEQDSRQALPRPSGYEIESDRRYGRVRFVFFRQEAAS